MKIKKTIAMIMALAFVGTAFMANGGSFAKPSVTAYAAEEELEFEGEVLVDGIDYDVKSDHVVLLDCQDSVKGEVIIPETIKGRPVTVIRENAFESCSSLEKIELPQSVKEIGDNAFLWCTSLKEVVIPDSVTKIGRSAFYSCNSLAEINIPDSITELGINTFSNCKYLKKVTLGKAVASIGTDCFSSCILLTEITIPKTVKSANYAFENSGLKKVTFEDGIDIIPSYMFVNAKEITDIVIPDSVKKIGQSAFSNCSGLKKVKLGKSVSAIGLDCFSQCQSLTEIFIPKTVKSAGYAFENSGLEKITFEDGTDTILSHICASAKKLRKPVIPEGVETIEEGAFTNCESLNECLLPESLTTMGMYVFSNCKNLKEIVIPSNVIHTNYSFDNSGVETMIFKEGMEAVPQRIAINAKNLKTVYLPDSVSKIGNSAFENCINLETIKSNRTIFEFYENSFANCDKLSDARFSVFDLLDTSFEANTDSASVNGIVNCVLKYKLSPSMAENAKNMEIQVNIPYGMSLVLDSVQSKNVEIDPESFEKGYVAVDSPEGEIRFSARVNEIGEYNISAYMKFSNSGSVWKSLVGKVDVECPKLTVAVPESVNDYCVEVHGLAPKGQEVTVYVNGQPAGKLTASEYTGKYSGTVKLPEDAENGEYSIYSVCGSSKTDEVNTVYSKEKPVVENIKMIYRDTETDITDVLLGGVSPVVSYNPVFQLGFSVSVSNDESIDKLFITSQKGDVIKYLEAVYDPETDLWTASGYFDDSNHSYIPGALNVSIIEKKTTVIDSSTYDFEADQKIDTLPQEYYDNSSVELIGQNGNASLAQVNLSDGVTEQSFHMYSDSDSEYVFIDGEKLSAEEIAKDPENYGFRESEIVTIEDGKRTHYYSRIANSEDALATVLFGLSDIASNLGDIWNGGYILKVAEGDLADDILVKMTTSCASETAGQILENIFGENYSAIGNGLSLATDTFKYLGQLEMSGGDSEYMTAATVLFALKCVNTFGTDAILASCGVLPPLSTVIKVGITCTLDSVDDYLMDCIRNNKEFTLSGYIRFIIDPSGIVYEAVFENPVPDAKVTIYYLDSETNEAVEWNAADFEQLNPLMTDTDGRYLWDVPEGQWKVVCEKEGYETVESDWFAIPPVRTDVNFSLVNKTAPELVSADMKGSEIAVKFSKFVDVTTVTKDTLLIDGFDGDYTITPKLLAEDEKYADTFIISGKFTKGIKTVSVTDKIKSYAGTDAKKGSMTITTSAVVGDVNGDGTVNLKDVVLIRRFIAGGWDADVDKALADANGDGTVNLKDVVLIRRFIAGGWNVEL